MDKDMIDLTASSLPQKMAVEEILRCNGFTAKVWPGIVGKTGGGLAAARESR